GFRASRPRLLRKPSIRWLGRTPLPQLRFERLPRTRAFRRRLCPDGVQEVRKEPRQEFLESVTGEYLKRLSHRPVVCPQGPRSRARNLLVPLQCRCIARASYRAVFALQPRQPATQSP